MSLNCFPFGCFYTVFNLHVQIGDFLRLSKIDQYFWRAASGTLLKPTVELLLWSETLTRVAAISSGGRGTHRTRHVRARWNLVVMILWFALVCLKHNALYSEQTYHDYAFTAKTYKLKRVHIMRVQKS